MRENGGNICEVAGNLAAFLDHARSLARHRVRRKHGVNWDLSARQVIEWIAQNLPKDTYLNIMSQYRPMYKARQHPEINRRITRRECDDAVSWTRAAGLTYLDVQGHGS